MQPMQMQPMQMQPMQQMVVNINTVAPTPSYNPIAPEVTPEYAKLGFNGYGKDIARGMVNPHFFMIARVVEEDGCCWGFAACSCVKSRNYTIITDTFLESNTPFRDCCCVMHDSINKQYYDRFLKKKCCGLWSGGFATEADFTYCCYCIPCVCVYDCCTRPCWGGYVTYVPCGKGTCGYCLATRCGCVCCNAHVLVGVKDSRAVADEMQKQVYACRVRQQTMSRGL